MAINMEKTELAKRVASRMGLTQRVSKRLVFVVVDEVAKELKAGGTVRLAGLGSASVKDMPPRKFFDAVRRRYGEVPAHKALRWRVSKKIKDELNRS